jgi:hypothetical protein
MKRLLANERADRPRDLRLRLFLVGLVFSMSLQAANVYPGCPAWYHQLTFVNNSKASVYIRETPGCLPQSVAEEPFKGDRCWPAQANGGFDLKPGVPVRVQVISCWSGNFGVLCGNCKSGVQTLVEFTFDGGIEANGKKLPGILDTYDVSLVDGFTKALSVSPDKNVPPGGGACATAGCQTAPLCPKLLVDGDACLSPNQYVTAHRLEFTSAERKKYGCVCGLQEAPACSGAPDPTTVPAGCVNQFGCSPFSEPGKSHLDSACCPFYGRGSEGCEATSKERAWDSWAIEYISAIHQSCPGEYAWQFDDKHGTFTCQGNSHAQMNYTIVVSDGSASSSTIKH